MSRPSFYGLLATVQVATSFPVLAQIRDVDPLCADRPIVAGGVEASAPRQPLPTGSPGGRAAADLFCIDLLGTTGGRGVVELGRVPSPFGVALTAEGHHVYRLTAWIDGLPLLGRGEGDSVYVAWATTPVFDRVVSLGQVRNGRNDLGPVAFNKFLVLVSVEGSVDTPERRGRLVLRGRSPSSRMEAHDLLAQAPAAVRPPASRSVTVPSRWERPPMLPNIPMLPGLSGLEPRVAPLALLPPSVDGLPLARPGGVVRLPDGGTLDLEAGFVRREIEGTSLVMMAFNGQHPGPLIRVRERSTIFVNFTNSTTLPTAVHWHGVRLDNRFDGVPGVTQDPVPPGGSFRYQVFFRDAGIYWYHPHHREDVQQELGLYGNMVVEPLDGEFYSAVNREEVLILDDLLVADDGGVPFGSESANYMLMGRFGNVFLVNGEPDYDLEVARGEVVRFFLTNASNTRTFNVGLGPQGPGTAPPLAMKVVATDVGKFEREEWAESAVLAPAERYVVEVRFPEPGEYVLRNRVQGIDHRRGVFLPEVTTLGTIRVTEQPAAQDHEHAFTTLRENVDVLADIDRYRERFDDPPERELVLSLEIDDLPLAVEQSMRYDWIYFNPVEWTGTMPLMNWATTDREVRWILRDLDSMAENLDIDWRFEVGDVVKIRVTNDRGAFHAMQHPLHIHGQRFLVLEQNGVRNSNLAWKDTVLLPSGSTTDILLELSNPGQWMVHCHIAEHLESGMKFVMHVERN